MDVKLTPIDAIRPYEKNPRINDKAVDAVAASLEEFGFRQPIVADTDGVIIVGHTRWKAAKKLGLKKVPVHVAKDLTPEQIRAYRLADNQTATLAEWDMELLPIELAALREADFDLDLIGFSDAELAGLLEPISLDGQTDPDQVPAPPDEATTQRGDIWILGDHRLMCGDSASVEDLDRLLDGQPVHLVNTDPPYNVKVEPRSNNAIAAGLSSASSAFTWWVRSPFLVSISTVMCSSPAIRLIFAKACGMPGDPSRSIVLLFPASSMLVILMVGSCWWG